VSFTVDTTGYSRMAHELADMGAVPYESVILFSTGRVLNRCIELTKGATVAGIDASVHAKFNNYGDGKYGTANTRGVDQRISIAPTAGHKWWVSRNADGKRTFYIMNDSRRRWSDARWAQYQNEELQRQMQLRQFLPKAKGARGLAKRSWLQIAEDLGISVEGVAAYVRGARPSTGKTFVNGTGKEFRGTDSFFVEIANNYPALAAGRLHGETILQKAINGRIQGFETDLRKGVFDNLTARAKKYPGVFVS
jgi:hypothetical protein